MPRQVRFGLNADPNVGGLEIATRISQLADRGGIELVGVQDHPAIARFLDTFTVITWLAARTSRVHFFPNVANLGLRPPVLLAKQVASMDVASGGRIELALGSGGFPEANAGMGGPRYGTAQAREALGEAVDVIRAFWAGQPFGYQGRFVTAPAVEPGPAPAHDIGLWLGVAGRRSLRLVGAKADGWSVSAPYVPPERLRELNEIITASALEAGRDPERITRVYNVMGLVGGADKGPFDGPAGRWVDTLIGLYAEHGMDTFVFWPSRDRERQSAVFAEEVVPAVREALAEG